MLDFTVHGRSNHDGAQKHDATKQESSLVPDKMSVAMIVNGVETQLKVTPWTTLLDVLRDHLDLTGTKKGEAAMSQTPLVG